MTGHKYKWFVRRPHTLEQLRNRAGYAPALDDIILESELRNSLNIAMQKPNALLQGRVKDEFALRLTLGSGGGSVVYAIIRKSNENKVYDYIVTTILTTNMFQAWTVDGRLGEIGDLSPEKRELPIIEPKLFLHYTNGDKKSRTEEYSNNQITHEITKLLEKGVLFSNIKILKEIPWKIDINLLGDIHTM